MAPRLRPGTVLRETGLHVDHAHITPALDDPVPVSFDTADGTFLSFNVDEYGCLVAFPVPRFHYRTKELDQRGRYLLQYQDEWIYQYTDAHSVPPVGKYVYIAQPRLCPDWHSSDDFKRNCLERWRYEFLSNPSAAPQILWTATRDRDSLWVNPRDTRALATFLMLAPVGDIELRRVWYEYVCRLSFIKGWYTQCLVEFGLLSPNAGQVEPEPPKPNFVGRKRRPEYKVDHELTLRDVVEDLHDFGVSPREFMTFALIARRILNVLRGRDIRTDFEYVPLECVAEDYERFRSSPLDRSPLSPVFPPLTVAWPDDISGQMPTLLTPDLLPVMRLIHLDN